MIWKDNVKNYLRNLNTILNDESLYKILTLDIRVNFKKLKRFMSRNEY